MKLIERFRQRLHFHEAEATKFRNTIALIEQELQPQMRSSIRRKINGALAQHLATVAAATDTPATPAPAAPSRRTTRPRGNGGNHHAYPPGYVKHAAGTMSLTDAIRKALAQGPLNQADLVVQVDKLRGTPTNRNSLLVSCAKLANDGALAQGKHRKGVYGLPAHKHRIKAVEDQTILANAKK
jgi:hypothetical protein